MLRRPRAAGPGQAGGLCGALGHGCAALLGFPQSGRGACSGGTVTSGASAVTRRLHFQEGVKEEARQLSRGCEDDMKPTSKRMPRRAGEGQRKERKHRSPSGRPGTVHTEEDSACLQHLLRFDEY